MRPLRNIEVTINVLYVDVDKQRIEVNFNSSNDLTFINHQRIQFFDSNNQDKIYTGILKIANGQNYIENILSNDENFVFNNLTTSDSFITYDYYCFWLPNQENFLTLKMVYDFFKDKSIPNIVKINSNNGIENYSDENSMFGFVTPFDKKKLDNSKFYVKSDNSYSNSTSRTFYVRVNNYRQFDIILFGDNSLCHMNCCFSSNDNLSVVFVHNNFTNNITIDALKLYNNDETYLKIDITGDETNSCIIGIENIEDIFGYIDQSEYSTETLTFNNGTASIIITPKTFKVDKLRILSFEDSSSGAIEIEQGTDLKDILNCGEYYCVDNTDILNKPQSVTGEFTLLCFSNGYNQRPLRYEMIDSNGETYIGRYDNGSIVWKNILNELPEHSHPTNQIVTNVNNQFVSQADITRWNNMAAGSSVWSIRQNIVSPEQNTWNIRQLLLQKEFLYVSNDLDLVIDSLEAGHQGLVVIKNLSANSVNINIHFTSISVLMLGVDTNITSNDSTITVPNSKGLEIYYMRLDDNHMVCKTRLLNVSNISNIDYRVVGEENDVVIPSI